MIITYFRSSSYNCHDMCEQQYYLEYVLGHRGVSNIKADKGTIVHKVLELLAQCKKAEQDGLKSIYDKEVYGTRLLHNIKRCKIDTLTEEAFNHYSGIFKHHNWTKKDLNDCKLWVEKAISLNDGMFDPRKREIVAPETSFDFIIRDDWAKFSYEQEGKIIEGNLGLKGTIDLVTKIDDNMYEIVDWKTGRRLNWATGEEKTYAKLMKDPQLMIYHYAASIMFPEIENIMITINYINDGGPVSLCFNNKNVEDTKQMLRKKFERIKATKIPRLSKTWKCQKFCYFGKNSFPKPLIETRTGQFTKPGEPMTMCQEIEYRMKHHGMDWVNKHYTKDSHQVGDYKSPGST